MNWNDYLYKSYIRFFYILQVLRLPASNKLVYTKGMRYSIFSIPSMFDRLIDNGRRDDRFGTIIGNLRETHFIMFFC